MRFLPLILTVGNVLAFPYYIMWLRNVTLTLPMFALMFALHSFAAAGGYQICVKRPSKHVAWIYGVIASLYIFVGLSAELTVDLMYLTVGIQIALGFVQGYFRAWHVNQSFYKLHAVSNYLLVGFVMLGLAFVKIISPQMILLLFGIILAGCFLFALVAEYIEKKQRVIEKE